jgi:hypothetical protein
MVRPFHALGINHRINRHLEKASGLGSKAHSLYIGLLRYTL